MKELPTWLQELWELDSALARKAEKHYLELISEPQKSDSLSDVINSIPKYDVDEINEIISKVKNGDRTLFEAIGALWNKAYTLGEKSSCL